MIYEQKIVLTVRYDPTMTDPPENWIWPALLDVDQDEVTLEEAGPITVVEGDSL